MEKSTESQEDLTEEGFNRYSVWTWDPSNTFYIPVVLDNANRIPEEIGTAFIKASIRSENGLVFPGYIVGPVSFYCFGIFQNSQEYSFNRNLPEFHKETLEDLRKEIDRLLLPFTYSSSVKDSNDQAIAGALDYPAA